MAETIGVEDTLKLCEVYGSAANKRRWRLYVPTVDNLSANHRIVSIIGWESAVKLAAMFGGEDIPVPHCENAKRRAAVWADFMADRTVREVAVLHGLTERRVRQITAEERGEMASDHFQIIGGTRSPAKSAAARLNGMLGGNPNHMIKEILARLAGAPQTPYGSLLTTVKTFQPVISLKVSEEKALVISVERAIETIAACLPGELQVRHGDRATLVTITPSKKAESREAILMLVETPFSPKALSQNALVVNSLEALAISALIDKSTPVAAVG